MSTPPRRQRATVACLSCSTRKKRCDGGRPCVSCTAAGPSCVYDDTGRKRKRGLIPGYVKVLESLYGQIFASVANSEDAVLQLLETLRLGQAFEDAEHEDNTAALSERWKQSRVCALIEQKLSEEDYTGSRRSNSRSVYTLFALPGGEQGQANRSSASDDAGPGSGSSHAPAVQTAVLSAAQLSQALSMRPVWEKISIVASSGVSLMLPSNTYELVDIFFTFTACWLPIIDRRSVFKTIDLYVQGESLVLEPAQERDQHALLWAVITYASFQRHSAAQDQRQHPRDEVDLTLEQLMQTTSALLELDSTKTKPFMIQAQVLISLVYCGRAEYLKAWRGVGKAIAALKSSHSTVDVAALAVTRAGCFVVDTLLATHTRLPAHFRGETIGYSPPEEAQEYEPWSNHTKLRPDEPVRSRNQPQRLFSIFSSLVDLLSIVSVFIGDESVETAQQSLTIWYNDFYRRHFQAFGNGIAQDVSWTPQMLNIMIIYNYVAASVSGLLDTDVDIHGDKYPLAEIRRLHSAWQKNFGLPCTPATMTLFLDKISANDIQGMFIGSRGRWLGETADFHETADVMSRDETTPRTQTMDVDELPTQFLGVSAQAHEARTVTARTQLGYGMTEIIPSADGLYHNAFAPPLETNTSTASGHHGVTPQSSHVPSFVNNQIGPWDVSSMPATSQFESEDLAFATFMDDFIYNLDSRQELDGQYLSNLGYVDGFENIYHQPQ